MNERVRVRPAGQTLGSGIAVARPCLTGDRPGLSGDEIILRLEEAGATLLALPATGYSTRLRQTRLDIVHTALEAYGWAAEPARAAAPDAAAISAMDEAFGWLALIPESKYVLRRILGARALVHPLTRRHLFPWRRLASMLGADHRSVQRWHGEGVLFLVRGAGGRVKGRSS